jgi:hypothetical protein
MTRCSAFVVALLFALALAGKPSGAVPRISVSEGSHVAIVHFGTGRGAASFRMREPAGVIRLYRIRAPRGIRLRATAQIPRLTVPLLIATSPAGPTSPCTVERQSTTCIVGEEWCPMPQTTWVFRVAKVGGPAGEIRLWFRVGPPPYS